MLYSASLEYANDAIRYFAAISDLPWAVWLDSAGLGEYDILCAQPAVTLLTYGKRTEIAESGRIRSSEENPFDLLRKMLGARIRSAPGIPFAGGAIGYWGYDLARRLKILPDCENSGQIPDMAIGLYDWAIVLDHRKKTAQLVSHQRISDTAEKLPQIVKRLQDSNTSEFSENFSVSSPVTPNMSRKEYRDAFGKVQKYLSAGDCYQVNLAQSFTARVTGDARQAYLSLRKLSPAPYSAYLSLPQAKILCASPERFLSLLGEEAETKPIKGTRPRMQDQEGDENVRQQLQSSVKDRAENLMIVDLLRNDLGRCCKAGSIKVPRMFEVESYAQVHHLVSTVTGRLRQDVDALALLSNCFPGGSVTGAPKHRAMEIIEELEPCRRGVYCGSIGYIGYDGNMDSNIAIRTLVCSEGKVDFWAGGAIVADSDAEAEYQELLDKAAAMMQMLETFSRGWNRK